MLRGWYGFPPTPVPATAGAGMTGWGVHDDRDLVISGRFWSHRPRRKVHRGERKEHGDQGRRRREPLFVFLCAPSAFSAVQGTMEAMTDVAGAVWVPAEACARDGVGGNDGLARALSSGFIRVHPCQRPTLGSVEA